MYRRINPIIKFLTSGALIQYLQISIFITHFKAPFAAVEIIKTCYCLNLFLSRENEFHHHLPQTIRW